MSSVLRDQTTYATEEKRTGLRVLYIAIGALLLFHLVANALFSYGYFRDELYYLACANRPAFGYVDHPPLSVWVLTVWKALFGNSLFAIRLVPALAIAGVLYFTGRSVMRMGGGALAVGLCSLCIITAPIFLAMGTYYSMNSLDMLFWAVSVYLLSGIITADPKRDHSKGWIFLGIIMGLALLNKISFLWFGTGLAVALLLTPLRKHLKTPWPYAAAGLTVLLFLPFIIWNLNNDMAHIEFMQNALRYKYSGIKRSDFITEAILQQNPMAVPVWIAGLLFYVISRRGRLFLPLGLIFMTTFIILLVNGHSKAEYLAASFPILFAGGSVLFDSLRSKKRLKWVPYALMCLLVFSIALAPMVKPLLPPDRYIAYSKILGIQPGNAEGKETASLHQFYADMHGWESMARDVSEVFLKLPQDERENARVYANNYGEAAALELYSDQYPMPYVMAGHNNYYLWGPGSMPLETVIIVGGKKEDHLQSFEEVKGVSVHTAPYAMPYENNLTIYVCREPRGSLLQLWPAVKNYN